MTFDDMLTQCVKSGASDIHLHAGIPPHVRINGHVKPLMPSPLTAQLMESLVTTLLNDKQRAKFVDKNQVDFAHSIPGVARFRVNMFRQRGSVSMVLRIISNDTSRLASVQLPFNTIAELAVHRRGIILVTGPTGSGKSTTLAAILDHINRTRAEMIVTIEDPIEILHSNQQTKYCGATRSWTGCTKFFRSSCGCHASRP
jgi:twitching motility protein PilT